MIKYLDYEGLQQLFSIVVQKDAKIENDVATVLSAMLSQLQGKADSDSVYGKEYVDNIVSTVSTQLNSKLPIDSFNEWSVGVAMQSDYYTKAQTYTMGEVDTKIDEITNQIGDINSLLEQILS